MMKDFSHNAGETKDAKKAYQTLSTDHGLKSILGNLMMLKAGITPEQAQAHQKALVEADIKAEAARAAARGDVKTPDNDDDQPGHNRFKSLGL